MTDPNVFDELTNRLTKTKRCDSGIHTSIEISTDNNKQDKKPISNDEQADSGRDSDHGGLDHNAQSTSKEVLNEKTSNSSNKDNTKKKSILNKFNGFKKIFKKSKSKTSIEFNKENKKSGGINNSSDSLGVQYKSHSEPDILAGDKDDTLKRCNSHSNPNSKAILSDSELSPEKKQSALKDAPSYIRTSLRKFKIKRNKSSATSSPSFEKFDEKKRHSIAEDVKGEETSESSNFFSKDDSLVSSIEGGVDLEIDLDIQSPKIESTAAKDRIRIAPKNRRRPKNVRGGTSARKEQFSALPVLNESEDVHEEDGENLKTIPDVPKIISSSNEKIVSLDKSEDKKKGSIGSLELPLSRGFSSHELSHSPLFNSQELRFSLFLDPAKSIESLNNTNINKSASMHEIAKNKENINQWSVKESINKSITNQPVSSKDLTKLSGKENINKNIVNQPSVSSKDLTKLQKQQSAEITYNPTLKNKKHSSSFNSSEHISSQEVLPRRVSVPAKLRDSKSKSMVIMNETKDPNSNEFLKLFQSRKSYDSELWNHKIFYSGEKKLSLPTEDNIKVSEFQKSRKKILNRRSIRSSTENIIGQGLTNNQADIAGLKPRSASTNPSMELSVEKRSNAVNNRVSADIPKNDEDKTIQMNKKEEKSPIFKSAEKLNSKGSAIPAKPPRALSPVKLSSSLNSADISRDKTAIVISSDEPDGIIKKSVMKVASAKEISRIPSFSKNIKRERSKTEEKDIAKIQVKGTKGVDQDNTQAEFNLKPQAKISLKNEDTLAVKTKDKLDLKIQEKKSTEIISNTKIPTRQPSFKATVKKDLEKTLSNEKNTNDSTINNKNDIESKIPAYSRNSLKKVPKRSDYLEDSTEEYLGGEINVASQDLKSISPTSPTSPTSTNQFGFNRSKSLSKPPVSAKPKPKTPTPTEAAFSFQSKDIVRSKIVNDKDANSKNEETKIPDWIKLAKQKQTEVSTDDTEQDEEAVLQPV